MTTISGRNITEKNLLAIVPMDVPFILKIKELMNLEGKKSHLTLRSCYLLYLFPVTFNGNAASVLTCLFSKGFVCDFHSLYYTMVLGISVRFLTIRTKGI